MTSLPSHLYISNPLCFTFLSPSHDSCFFCCSLGACPGFRNEVLAQIGEWAVLPSCVAPPQPRWHTYSLSSFSHSCSPWQVHKSVFHLRTAALGSQTCRKPDCNRSIFSLAIFHKYVRREETWTKSEWKRWPLAERSFWKPVDFTSFVCVAWGVDRLTWAVKFSLTQSLKCISEHKELILEKAIQAITPPIEMTN